MEETKKLQKARQRVWEIVEAAKPGDKASRVFDLFMFALIVLNVAAVIVGSVKSVEATYGHQLQLFETFSVAVFTVEYLARLWACVCRPEFARSAMGRLRFALRPMQIIDLLAILPFYLEFMPIDARFVRIFRLFRLLRLAKLNRYSKTSQMLARVFASRKEELLITASVMIATLILASSFIYFAENEAQPDKFPDIPSAMWWAIVTLTTVGYGDVYPVTTLGKFLAATIAVLGIGLFALPAGILGASFVEEIERQKAGKQHCPHCGEELE
ncbi:MAG: ion transporter [Acidobacteriota bacterium]|nr:ion transporter [Acidobacteriota bacterium]